MGAYNYHSEGLIFNTIKQAIAKSKWSVEFGEGSVQIATGNARIVTQPIYIYNVDYSTFLTFWGIGEGTARNNCHALAAATTARRQAMLSAMGWQQSRDDEDGEFKPDLQRITEFSPTGRSDRNATQPEMVNQPPPRTEQSTQAVEPVEPKKKSKARVAYDAATTLADLKKSAEWQAMVTAFGLRELDIEARFTMDWKRVPKEEVSEYGAYVRKALPLIPELVDKLNDLFQRQRPNAIPFIFDETTSIEDIHVLLESYFGTPLDISEATLETIHQEFK